MIALQGVNVKTAPKPTSERLTLGMSERVYIRWDNGSLRREVQKPLGHATVKRVKRQRHKEV